MPVVVQVGLGAGLGSRRGVITDAAKLRRLLARAVRATLRHQGVQSAEMSVTLMADDEITDMNRQFLQHDGPTDVVSFALYEDDETPVGDVYVGYEQALRQAMSLDTTPAEELVRLTVHGVLHVLGHDHPPGDDRVESAMWAAQEAIVARVLPA
jgi:probable rRNA maturation factor